MSADPFEDIPDPFDDIPDVGAPAVMPALPDTSRGLEALDAERAAADPNAADADEGFKPWTGADRPMPKELVGESAYSDPNSTRLDTAADALMAGAGGTFSGLGINPTQLVGALGGNEAATRARLKLAHDRSPKAAGAAQLAMEIAPLAVVTGGTSAAEQLAKPVLGGAIQGGLSALGNADTDDWGERLEALTGGAGAGALFGKGAQQLGKPGRYVGGELADKWRNSGLLQRVAASGSYGSDIRKLADNIGGEEGLRKLGEWMEQKGIHKGKGLFGMLPQTAETYGKNAAAVNKAAMGERGAVLNELAQRPPVLVDTLPISSGLRADAQKLAGRGGIPGVEATGQAAQMSSLADSIRSKSQQGFQEFPQALDTRAYFDDLVSHRQIGGAPADTLRDEVNRRVANEYRGALSTGLEQQAPDLAPKFAGAQNDLSKGIDIERLAKARQNKELGNQVMSLPTTIMTAGALGAGGAGLLGGDAHDASKAGLGTAILGGTAMALAKSRGHAAAAGGYGGLAKAARGVGALAGPALQPVRNAATQIGQRMAGGLAADVSAEKPRIDDMAPPPTPAAATAGGRGNLLGEAALQALFNNRQALGKYVDQIAEAAGSGASGTSGSSRPVGDAVARLVQTDPEFRQTVLPILQRMTAGR